MRQLGQMKKSTKNSLFTYTLVIAAFVVVQALRMGPGVGAMLEGQLIPICAYIVMALALNLVVGVSGELSLGHAGFMSVGAFSGCCPRRRKFCRNFSKPVHNFLRVCYSKVEYIFRGTPPVSQEANI